MDTIPIGRFMTKARLACTQTLFIFLFVLLENVGERASKASAERKKEKYFLLLLLLLPLRWRSKNPQRFNFYHVCSADFEEKIEGL